MAHRIPERLGWVVVPPAEGAPVAAYLMHLPDGDPQALHGTAALIWTLAADGEPDVAGALAGLLDTPRAEVEASVDAYLTELVAARLLEED